MITSLRKLDSFGDVAAEDDSVLDYFLTTDAVNKIKDKKHILFLDAKDLEKLQLYAILQKAVRQITVDH